MHRTPLLFGSLSMAVAVILGALGAHGVKPYLAAEQMEAYGTAVDYQIYHSLGLLVVGLAFQNKFREKMKLLCWLFMAGIVLFSGSIYLLSTSELTGLGDSVKILGPITPIGGLCLITGWVLFFFHLLKSTRSHGTS